jgi:hypothetical protein
MITVIGEKQFWKLAEPAPRPVARRGAKGRPTASR